jgi:hypothetical protein
MWHSGVRLSIALAIIVFALAFPGEASGPWQRHVIDNSSRGADGVRLADVNGDGLLDFATGWEEGGVVRVYVNPGPKAAKAPWPAVTVGAVKSPEDAVLVDLDGDGAMDVVSSCEGKTRTAYVHWAPTERKDYLNPTAWRAEPIPATVDQHLWMYALPFHVDGQRGVDLVIGSKSGALGWLQSPQHPRDLSAWTYHPLGQAGWVMSLEAVDLNGDGRLDLLVSDRKGKNRGVLWLEHPGAANVTGQWREHRIASEFGEVMFLDATDIDGDGRTDVAVAVKPRAIVLLYQPEDALSSWRKERIEYPETFGTAKAVRVADVDLDGRLDLVGTCEEASGPKSGVFWLRRSDGRTWDATDIGGPEGLKYDRIELLDLDGDGDLDLLTCEERDNLGVIWYENSTR